MGRVTLNELQRMADDGRRITMLTAYDYPMARLVDQAGVEIVLVGDSLAMVVLGLESTTSVTMDEMLHHAKAARRGVQRALLVGDMPFGSFHGGAEAAIRNATRFLKEAGCDAVKLEWTPGVEKIAAAIVQAGIPVMGHVGLTPQTAASLGGFKVQGRDAASASRILGSAVALEEAGCFAMVLECIPDRLAAAITRRLAIPTIGIGAGPSCDGQVLVTHDLLGLFDRFTPKFVKRYANLSATIVQAVQSFRQEVQEGKFPSAAQTFTMAEGEFKQLEQSRGGSGASAQAPHAHGVNRLRSQTLKRR